MKTTLTRLLLATALALAAFAPSAFSDSQTPSAASQLRTLATLIEEVIKEKNSAIKEVETAKSDDSLSHDLG